MRALNIITLLLIIIGGLNWGLIALFDFDLARHVWEWFCGCMDSPFLQGADQIPLHRQAGTPQQ
jgi:hypothetical protein